MSASTATGAAAAAGDRKAWRESNAHLFAPPPRADASEFFTSLQTVSRKLERVQQESAQTERGHEEVLRNLSRELHLLANLPLPSHADGGAAEACFAAIEVLKRQSSAAMPSQASPSSSVVSAANAVAPRAPPSEWNPAVSSDGAVAALKRIIEILGGDVTEIALDETVVVSRSGHLAVDVTRRLEQVTRDHIVTATAFEAYARDVKSAMAGVGVVSPDAGEYIRRVSDAAAMTALAEAARRSTEWFGELVAKLRATASNLGVAQPHSTSTPATVLAFADDLLRGAKEVAVDANRGIAAHSAALGAIVADVGLPPSADVADVRTRLVELRAQVDAALSEYSGADLASTPTFAHAVTQAVAILRGVASGSDRLVASRVEDWIVRLRVATKQAALSPTEATQIVVAPRAVLEQEIDRAITNAIIARDDADQRIAEVEDAHSRAVTAANELHASVVSALHQTGVAQSAPTSQRSTSSVIDAATMQHARTMLQELVNQTLALESSLGRVTRQSDSHRLERTRIEELVRSRFSRIQNLCSGIAATAESADAAGGAPMAAQTAGEPMIVAADVAQKFDQLDAVIIDSLRHAEKQEAAARSERVRADNLVANLRTVKGKSKSVVSELHEVCTWLGVRGDDVLGASNATEGDVQDRGPVQLLGSALAMLERCKETCAVSADEEGETVTAKKVGVEKVKASAMALQHCVELQAEVDEAKASEAQLTESLVMTSKRLCEMLRAAKKILTCWSHELASEAVSEARHAFTIGSDDEMVTYIDTDDVPDDVELTGAPLRFRMVSLSEALDFMSIALPQFAERLSHSCGYLQKAHECLTNSRSKIEVSDGYVEDLVVSLSNLADRVLLTVRGVAQPARESPKPAAEGTAQLQRLNARTVTSPGRPAPQTNEDDVVTPPRPLQSVDVAQGQQMADHRLVRVAIALSRAWSTMTSVASVKYIRLASTGAACDAIMYGDGGSGTPSSKSRGIIPARKFFPWLGNSSAAGGEPDSASSAAADVLHDTLVPELEAAASKLEMLTKAFGEGYKQSVITIQRDVDASLGSLYTALEGVDRCIAVSGLVPDTDRFYDMMQALKPSVRPKHTYFFDREDGTGKGIGTAAAEHAQQMLEVLCRTAVEWKELVDGQADHLQKLHDIVEAKLIQPGLARPATDPWGARCRDLVAIERDLPSLLTFMSDAVSQAYTSPDFIGPEAAAKMHALQRECASAVAARDAAESAAAVARATLAKATRVTSAAPSPAARLDTNTSVASQSNVSRAQSPMARVPSHVSVVASQPVSRNASLTRSQPIATPHANGASSSYRRVAELTSVRDLPKSPERVGRHLQRTHYFQTVLQEYTASLDEELVKRKTMSPPRHGVDGVQLSPMTVTPHRSPLRRSSSATNSARQHQAYSRLHSGQSSVAKPVPKRSAVQVAHNKVQVNAASAGAGGDVVVHPVPGHTVRSTSVVSKTNSYAAQRR